MCIRDSMKDIHEVLRQKQTKYAQLGKQIEMLQQAGEKLREVAPLLAHDIGRKAGARPLVYRKAAAQVGQLKRGRPVSPIGCLLYTSAPSPRSRSPRCCYCPAP